jgi:histidinol phosphatase-like PHP family hydrolase
MQIPRFTECDFHVHTEYSGERQARGFTIRRMFEEADRLGLKYIGYSEHWHPDTSPALFARIRDEVERLQPRYSVRVLISAEIDTLDSRGNLSADPVKAASILDYASAAVSRFAQAVAESGVRIAPGSDAHNRVYWDGSGQWFGNNAASYELLRAAGFNETKLWYGPGT